MKAVKWILIALALIAVIVITLPAGGFFVCDHDYHKDACNISHCQKCGDTLSTNAKHTWNYATCKAVCSVCGKVGPNSHYLQVVPCTNQVYCTRCDYTETRSNVQHNVSYTDRIMTDLCHYYLRCKDCHQNISSGESHTWSARNECTDVFCVYCGTAAPDSYAHRYLHVSDMFDFPTVCQDCGKWHFPPFSIGAICVLLGLIMCIAAFIFIYFNRKRIRIREGRYFCAVTPESQMREKGTEEEYA